MKKKVWEEIDSIYSVDIINSQSNGTTLNCPANLPPLQNTTPAPQAPATIAYSIQLLVIEDGIATLDPGISGM